MTLDFAITNNKGNSSDLRELFVFYKGNNTNSDDIIRIYKSMVGEQCIPAFFLPIGDDSGGNPICMSLLGDEYGAVFFCDHELENKETGFLATSKIADSFTDFINELFVISQ